MDFQISSGSGHPDSDSVTRQGPQRGSTAHLRDHAGDWGGGAEDRSVAQATSCQSLKAPRAQGWPCCWLAPQGKLQTLKGAYDK